MAKENCARAVKKIVSHPVKVGGPTTVVAVRRLGRTKKEV
jgi:hypothetical protein